MSMWLSTCVQCRRWPAGAWLKMHGPSLHGAKILLWARPQHLASAATESHSHDPFPLSPSHRLLTSDTVVQRCPDRSPAGKEKPRLVFDFDAHFSSGHPPNETRRRGRGSAVPTHPLADINHQSSRHPSTGIRKIGRARGPRRR